MKILENQEIVCRLVGCKKNFAESNAKKGDLAVILTKEKLVFVEKILNENRYGYIPIKMLDRIYFEPGKNFLVAQVNEDGYAFQIYADEKDMRKLCKAFKKLKQSRPIKMHDDLMLSEVITIVPSENSKNKEKITTSEIKEEQDAKVSQEGILDSKSDKNSNLVKKEMQKDKEVCEKTESSNGKMQLSGITIENKESLFGNKEDKQIKKKFSLFSKKK